MNEFSQIAPIVQATPISQRGWRYLAIGVATNAAVWSLAGYALRESPRQYTSQWSVVLMSESKPELTLALSQTELTHVPLPAAKTQDLKTRYQVIATAEEVSKSAAAKIGMTDEQFGSPQVTPIAGSSLMTFEISGSTPEEAQSKAQAFHEALQERLNQLRVRHTTEQAAGFEDSLSAARKKVEVTKARLSDYKLKSGVVSSEQVNQLAAEVEALRQMRTETLAQQQTSSQWSSQLSSELSTRTGSARDDLFKTLVTNNTEQQELTLRVQQIDRELADLKQRLSESTQRRSALESLQRDTQVAEAVFSSTLAGLNARKLDVSSAYPPVQVIADPTLPKTATLPRQRPILFSAVIASLTIAIGLCLAWVRQTPIAKHFHRRLPRL